MKKELLIMRHGKSDWSIDADDFDRPLTDWGTRSAQRQGVWLWQQDLVPDHVVSSPAERALVTAQKACKAMGISAQGIAVDPQIYEGNLGDLLVVLAGCPDKAQRVLLVGHIPGVVELLEYLSGPPASLPDDGSLFPTAGLARLEMPDDWSRLEAGVARLQAITRPDGLPKKFPFPAPNGTELRDRPAYYYNQSSVIPYRIINGELQILVILSSKKKHFVVPKGIKDPGLTPQESAAKEAWEEAGVEGAVSAQPIGSYTCEKWGATCAVEVYSMEVSRLVPEDEWEESHRGREWVSAKQAMKRLKQEELGQLVCKLEQRFSTA